MNTKYKIGDLCDQALGIYMGDHATSANVSSIISQNAFRAGWNRCAEIKDAEIAELKNRQHIPFPIAYDCLSVLAPLDTPGEPNTLHALCHRAMARIKELEEAILRRT